MWVPVLIKINSNKSFTLHLNLLLKYGCIMKKNKLITITIILLMFSQLVLYISCSSVPKCSAGNCIDGRATMKFPGDNNFKEYNGNWRNSAFHGQGTLLLNDGTRYSGGWKNNLKHGFGTLYAKGGKVKQKGFWGNNIYLGDCVSGNCINGKGNFAYADGSKYVGSWRSEKKDGKGVLYKKDGSVDHEGLWKNDIYSGRCIQGNCVQGVGTFIYSDGSKYFGNWQSGKKEGSGILYSSKKEVLEKGTWEYGEYIGACSKGNCKNGKGTYLFSNGSSYTGSFKKGNRHGKGTLFKSDGTVDKKGLWLYSRFWGDYKNKLVICQFIQCEENSSCERKCRVDNSSEKELNKCSDRCYSKWGNSLIKNCKMKEKDVKKYFGGLLGGGC